jgi:Zn-dependent protease
MPSGGWRLGRVGGVEIRVDPSWSVIAVLFGFTFWVQFSDQSRFPGLAPAAAVSFATLTSILFFGSVLAHELAHAGMSKARGIPVSGIVLFLFGGATQADVEAKGPADEFLVTLVGPLTSLTLGGLFIAGHILGRNTLPRPIGIGVFEFLGRINLALGVFNLLPGFPLDGGRLLRSALWRATGNLERATVIAARVGQAVGIGIVAVGVAAGLHRGDAVYALWFAFVGWFLFRAASGSMVHEGRRRLLRLATVRDAMSTPPPTIPEGLPLGVAIELFLDGHDGEAFPVTGETGVIGFVSLRTARGIPPDRPVRDATTELQGVLQASPDDRMDVLVDRLVDAQRRTVLVMEGNRLVGVVEPEDMARFLNRAARRLPSSRAPIPVPPRPDSPRSI